MAPADGGINSLWLSTGRGGRIHVGAGGMAADALQPVQYDFEVRSHGVLLLLEAAELAEQDEGPVALDACGLAGGKHDHRASQLLERMGV
jgi:hypothetical protein